MKVFEFANKIQHDDQKFKTTQIRLLLSNKSYRNEYNYTVLPMKAILRDATTGEERCVSFQDMIDICGRIPYIKVHTNRQRKVFQQFMVMTICMIEKEYEGNKYYDYRINPLEEMKTTAAGKIKELVNENIKCFKEKQSDDESIGFSF